MSRFELHPNTRSAIRLVFATLLSVSAFVVLLQFSSTHDDSTRIAYASFDGNDYEIFTVNPDGSDIQQLTNNDYNDWGATWSPNHEQLAFRSDANGYAAIYVMDADGNHVVQVTDYKMNTGTPEYQATLSWSPDGSHILFSADVDGNWDIYSVNIINSEITRLTFDPLLDLHPDWSPDGQQIAFNSYRDGYLEIYVMDADGSNIEQITHDEDRAVMFPRWSPDSQQIVFYINDSEYADLYLMDADGSNVKQLTQNIAIDRVATFSPDGSQIVFRSERDGDSDIYRMNLATGDISSVTNNTMADMSPDW